MKPSYRTLALHACLGLAFLAPAYAQDSADPVVTAANVLDHMEAGHFDAVTAQFNAQMAAALDSAKLAGVQQQIDSAGPVQARGEPRVSRQGGMTIVAFRVQRALATLDATVAIDAAGKIAGLHFAPAAADGE